MNGVRIHNVSGDWHIHPVEETVCRMEGHMGIIDSKIYIHFTRAYGYHRFQNIYPLYKGISGSTEINAENKIHVPNWKKNPHKLITVTGWEKNFLGFYGSAYSTPFVELVLNQRVNTCSLVMQFIGFFMTFCGVV